MPHGFITRSVHVGQTPHTSSGDIVPPLHLTSTFTTERVDQLTNVYEYSRAANPTRDAFQEALASLEEGEHARAFPSGMSAEDTLLRAVTRPGDHITFGTDVYGGTYRLFTRVLTVEGRASTPVDLTDLELVARTVRENRSRVLWVETPSNPLLQVYDLRELSRIAHEADVLLIVDNTFASPYLQRPLTLGADAVVHSTTKYIGGHSDLVGGAVVLAEGLAIPSGIAPLADTGLVADDLQFLQATVGAVPGAFDAYLASRGLKTLAVRVARQSATALEVAEYLAQHPAVRAVHYPGLSSDPGHDLAARQMDGFGGVLSFEARDPEAAVAICQSTSVFALGVSLGAAESLIEYPAIMTHGAKSGTPWAIDPSLIRLAIGLEDPQDLIEDLERALAGGK